jgi:hypothetical protein
VVARHDDRLAPRAQARPDGAQHGLGHLHRLRRAAFEQLDDVAEQHEAIDARERLEQGLERPRAAQHVALQARAEVEVGDDEGPHRGGDDARSLSGAASPRARPWRASRPAA